MASQLAANIISAVVALATLAAVITAFIAIMDNRKQARQTYYHASRPLLIPEGKPQFQRDHANWLDWNVDHQEIAIRNVGSGVALNSASVLYGCESYVLDMFNNRRSEHEKSIHWTAWIGTPIVSGETKTILHEKGNGMFYEKNMHLGQYRFNAPPEPRAVPHQTQPFILARITITYLDIFQRKHASIFDYVQHTDGWQLVAFLEDIAKDLHDLEGS